MILPHPTDSALALTVVGGAARRKNLAREPSSMMLERVTKHGKSAEGCGIQRKRSDAGVDTAAVSVSETGATSASQER